MPDVYACPSCRNGDERSEVTSYVAVVGMQTAWPGSRGKQIQEVTDGTCNTVLLIEFNSGSIPWTEPRDLNFDDALSILTSTDPETWHGHPREDFFHTYYDGRQILLADGSARSMAHGFDSRFWSELLTVDDGRSNSNWDTREPVSVAREALKIGNCSRFAVFVLLALFPLPWVWRKGRVLSEA